MISAWHYVIFLTPISIEESIMTISKLLHRGYTKIFTYSLIWPYAGHRRCIVVHGSISARLNYCNALLFRWTSHVAPKPPNGGSKRKTAVFQVKSQFAWRKSATKFLCAKSVSGKVVRHSLSSVRKWLVNLFSASQDVQYAAARLVTGTRRRDHITSVLR